MDQSTAQATMTNLSAQSAQNNDSIGRKLGFYELLLELTLKKNRQRQPTAINN